MNSFFMDPQYATAWTAIGAMAQGTASILAIVALIYSMTTFRKSLQASHYTELDRMYFDLLRLGVEKPHLRNLQAERTADQQAEYESYAWMIYNFLETVNDRCAGNAGLCETWHAAVDAEDRLYGRWLDAPENHHKFKANFHAFVANFRQSRPRPPIESLRQPPPAPKQPK